MSEHEPITILIVEHQSHTLLTYEVILRELGEHLLTARSVPEALTHLLTTDIPIILIDVHMPELDGFTLAQLIREHPRYQQTALIFISSESLTHHEQLKGYAYGLVDYLTAPVLPELLRAKVRVFANLYRTTAALHQEVAEHQRLERAAQGALAESQATRAFLETTLASIGDAVMATDTAGRIVLTNTVAQAVLRWPAAEMFGKPLDEVFRIINEYSRTTVESPVAKVLREGIVVGLANHTLLIARDGTEIPIDDSGAPIRDVAGTVHGTVLVFRDVTARRRAEETSRLLASIVASSDDAIISKDLHGVITSWNKSAERIFGYTAEEAMGQPITLIAAPDRVDEMPQILERIRQGERIDHYATVRRTKGGQLVQVSLTVSPIYDAVGRIVGASKIARDITARP
jgi:PAS domain S-box-containing protein